ncbi:MAG: hypothetical protein WBG23_02760 [Acidobacteriaceae bacterium]
MFKRLKKMLVESFVGAIGLGWIFATAIWDFTNALVNPLRIWMARSETFGAAGIAARHAGSLLSFALPGLIDCLLLLAFGYVLLRWLYSTPAEKPAP